MKKRILLISIAVLLIGVWILLVYKLQYGGIVHFLLLVAVFFLLFGFQREDSDNSRPTDKEEPEF